MGSTEAERTPLANNEEANFNPPPKYDAEAQNESEVEKFIEEKTAPVDKNNLVFLIILLHGIGTLMPWNMFINIAPAYYKDYKMMDRNETTGDLIKTSLSENFPLYLSLCSQLPNLLLNFINIFITVKGDLTKRISMSLSVVALTVIATMCFIYVDTWTWRIGFCVLTLATIVVLNSANGIYQNSIYGLAADFPFKYTNAVIIGNNACGTFVAVVNIVAFMLIDDVRGSAFLYFSIALLTLVVCFSSLFTLKKNPFYVYYRENSAAAASADKKEEEPKLTKQDYIDTFKQGWPMFLNVFLVFFVTLTCFPGLMMFVTPNGVGEEYDFPLLAEKDFTSFNCFLLFNLFAFIGSMLAGRFQYPGAKKLWIPIYLRILFIPFFFFCNLRAENRMWPVLIPSPWIYILGAILMSISSGYLSGLAMQFAPSVVEPSKQRIAGMMAGFFLIFGIVSGLTFTIVIMSLLTNFGPLTPAAVAL